MNPKDSKKVSKAELDLLCQKIVELCVRHPEKAALILTHWVHSPANTAAGHKPSPLAPTKTRKKAA